MYGVTESDVQKALYATERLHNFVQAGGVKRDSVVVITKTEDPDDARRKDWKVTVDGKEVDADQLQDGPQQTQEAPRAPEQPPPSNEPPPAEQERQAPQNEAPAQGQRQPPTDAGKAEAAARHNVVITAQVSATMDKAYSMAANILRLRMRVATTPEMTSACAHSMYITLADKRGYVPTDAELMEFVDRSKEAKAEAAKALENFQREATDGHKI